MPSEFEIGRVVAVDTAQVTIELAADLKALTRTTYEGAQEVGRINSYVVIPVGARRLVAMITRVSLNEEAQISTDRTMVTLPAARRLMKATLIGTIDGQSYTQGVSLFPILDNPVHLTTSSDLDVIFDRKSKPNAEVPNAEEPGFCVRLGDSPIFEGFPINIDPDAFFGKHAAILGSTGSGKSCTIASVLQSILERADVKHLHVVILDTNGEYRSAFQRRKDDGEWEDVINAQILYIPSDSRKTRDALVIPYWFMNADDFVRLFRAKEGLQSPVLLRALRLARSEATGATGPATALEVVRIAFNQIIATLENTTPSQLWAQAKNVSEYCEDFLRFRGALPHGVTALDEALGAGTFDRLEAAIQQVKDIASEVHKPPQRTDQAFGGTRVQRVREILDPLIDEMNRAAVSTPTGLPGVSADQPVFFERGRFLEKSFDTAMKEQAETGNPGRVREACGPMFLRVRRFFEDPRFQFLFRQFPGGEHVLAAFLRDALGLPSAKDLEPPLSNNTAVPNTAMPFYDRQREGTTGHQIVVVDLSLLAAEVLENVTALIGRLMLEFLQRVGEFGGEEARGSLPVVLVLEEAQNYIREQSYREEESISRAVFERIAREGRKYGLSLVVASQRPSELSKTVLSQCSSFIVHRLQNPEDLRYFKEIVPGIYGPLLDQLPALAPQTALVLGECVRAPAVVKIREARPVPRSKDPKFFSHWTQKHPPDVDVEHICADWEESAVGQTSDVKTGGASGETGATRGPGKARLERTKPVAVKAKPLDAKPPAGRPGDKAQKK